MLLIAIISGFGFAREYQPDGLRQEIFHHPDPRNSAGSKKELNWGGYLQ